MRKDLTGRVVAITGAARGIGLAIAESCAEAGMRLAVGDLDRDAADESARRLGGGAVGMAVDVADRRSIERFLADVKQQLAPLDVMVNNAGIHHAGPFDEEDQAITERLVAVNLLGVMAASRLAVQQFRRQGEGHLVNVASVGGLLPVPYQATYAATKHGVVGFTRSLRQELHGTGIDVTLVCPGQVETAMTATFARQRGVRVLEPSAIGDGVVRALRTGSGEVVLPREMSVASRGVAMLPSRLADAALRAGGAGRIIAPEHRRWGDRA